MEISNSQQSPPIIPNQELQLGGLLAPLTSLIYQASINGPLAHVVLTQIYINKADAPKEISFTTPIDPVTTISGLVITTKGNTIIGKVMPKQKAEEKYASA